MQISEIIAMSKLEMAGIGPICCLVNILSLIISIVIAYWMYKDAEKRGENAALWGVLGFFLGLIGLIIWLVVRPDMYEVTRRQTQNQYRQPVQQSQGRSQNRRTRQPLGQQTNQDPQQSPPSDQQGQPSQPSYRPTQKPPSQDQSQKESFSPTSLEDQERSKEKDTSYQQSPTPAKKEGPEKETDPQEEELEDEVTFDDEVKQRYKEEIEEWKEFGFEVGDLERLLKEDKMEEFENLYQETKKQIEGE